MPIRKVKSDTRLSLADIFREVKTTVQVYLTSKGISHLKDTPYLRENSHLNCSRIFDDINPHYLFAEVRYYRKDSHIPCHTNIAIPHDYIRYMAGDKPFHLKSGKAGG